MPLSPELLKQVGGVITKPTNALDVNKLGNGAGLKLISQPEPKVDPVNKTNTLDLSTLDTSHGTVKPKASTSAADAIAAGKADPITKTDIQFKQPTFEDDLYSAGQNFNIGAASNFESLAAGTKTLKARIEAQAKAIPEIWAAGLISTNPEQKPLIDKIIAQKFAESLAHNDSVDNILDELTKGYHQTATNYQDDLNTLKAKAGQDFTQVSFIDKLAQAAPSMIPLAAASLISGGGADVAAGLGYLRTAGVLATAAEVLPTVGEATQQAQSDYEQQLSEGKTPEEAMKTFDSSLAFNLSLLAISNKFSGIWKPENYKGLYELTKTALEEGAQEAGQQIYSNVLDKQNWFKDVKDNFLIGAILGFGVKGTTSVGGVNLQENQLGGGAEPPAGGGVGNAFDGFHLIPEDQFGGKQPSKDDLKKQIEESNAPQDKKDEAIKFLDTTDENTRGTILQNAVDDGSLQQFVEEIKNNNNERDTQIQQLQDLYQQQVDAGVEPTVIYQEISDRTGIPVDEIKTAITDLQTQPKVADVASRVAQELLDQHNAKTEIPTAKATPEDQIKNIAQETVKQDTETAPEITHGQENDAQAQQDWHDNYKIDYGNFTQQESYLRGQQQRLVQGAAKARVQTQLQEVVKKKAALKKEFVKNQTNVTKEDVKKALTERNAKKANRVLNPVGKKRTVITTKQGVRVNRTTDVEKPTKRQLEARKKAEGSFLDLKKGQHPVDELYNKGNERAQQIVEESKLSDFAKNGIQQNPLETSFTVGNYTFVFDTQTWNDFMEGTDPSEVNYFIQGGDIYLIDGSQTIQGKVQEFLPQTETLFQTNSRNRFATYNDITRAFENIPFLKYVPVEKVASIETPGGGSAWGSYFNGLIKYTENPKYGTLPHEAFHAFVDLILNPNEQANLYSLAREQMAKEGYGTSVTDVQAEEFLAEKFEDYYINKTEKGAFQKFFDKIIEALKSLVQSKKTIEDYYNAVFDPNNGTLLKANMEMTPISSDFLSEINPETTAEARDIIDQAEITQGEKNFLNNILDNPVYAKKTDWEAFKEEVGVRTLQVEGKVLTGRKNLIERGNQEVGLPENTPGFAWVVETEIDHGVRTAHGFTDGGKAIGWANVADTGDTYQVKEIQKISGREINAEIAKSGSEELQKIYQNYMSAFVITLRDKAANDFKILRFPSPEKAALVNPQADPNLIEKVYEKEMLSAVKKFTNAEFEEDQFGGDYVVYPSDAAKLVAHRFQTADAFEAIQQEHLTTKILNRLGDRKTVSKTFVSDLAKMPDIKQKEKDLINEVLKGEGATINVDEFKQKVRSELLPLVGVSEREVTGGTVPMDKYKWVTLDAKEKGLIAQYIERIYESPISVGSGHIHFESAYGKTANGTNKTPENYFGHVRAEDMPGEYVGTLRDNELHKHPNAKNLIQPLGSGAKFFEPGDLRRILEIQSDLYQRGRLEAEKADTFDIGVETAMENFQQGHRVWEVEQSPMTGDMELGKELKTLREVEDSGAVSFATSNPRDNERIARLEVYANPTAHFRMLREEISKAVEDGKKRLQVPTGETAMKIEGLGGTETDSLWYINKPKPGQPTGSLKAGDLKVGLDLIDRAATRWIVTDVLEDGKFLAIKRELLEDFLRDYEEIEITGENLDKAIEDAISDKDMIEDLADQHSEQFDISGKVDKSNPIFKFYEETLGKYVKNTYQAKPVKDENGVTWFEIELKPEMAGRVEAFQVKESLAEEIKRATKIDQKLLWSKDQKIREKTKKDLVKARDFFDKTEIFVSINKSEPVFFHWTDSKNAQELVKSQKWDHKKTLVKPEDPNQWWVSASQYSDFGGAYGDTLVGFYPKTEIKLSEKSVNKSTNTVNKNEIDASITTRGVEVMILNPDKFHMKILDPDEVAGVNGYENLARVSGEKFQEKDAYDRMGEILNTLLRTNETRAKKETFLNRVASELGQEFKGGFYTPQRIREELAKSEIFYETDPQKAIAVASGLEANPDNINDLALARYVLNKVTADGNADAQIAILNNLSKIARQYGQSIAMLQGAITIDSPNQFINQLKSHKEDLARKNFKALFSRSKSVVVEDLVDDQVRKLKKKKSTQDLKQKLLKEKELELDSFLNALAC
jgi:hypothetical protein